MTDPEARQQFQKMWANANYIEEHADAKGTVVTILTDTTDGPFMVIFNEHEEETDDGEWIGTRTIVAAHGPDDIRVLLELPYGPEPDFNDYDNTWKNSIYEARGYAAGYYDAHNQGDNDD